MLTIFKTKYNPKRKTTMLKIFFMTISTFLIFNILIGKLLLTLNSKTKHLSLCGLIMAITFTIYTIVAILIMLTTPDWTIKIFCLSIAIAPYIIGEFTKFKTLNIAIILQITTILIGEYICVIKF